MHPRKESAAHHWGFAWSRADNIVILGRCTNGVDAAIFKERAKVAAERTYNRVGSTFNRESREEIVKYLKKEFPGVTIEERRYPIGG